MQERHQNTSKDVENVEVVGRVCKVVPNSCLDHPCWLIAKGIDDTAQQDQCIWISSLNSTIITNFKRGLEVDEVDIEDQDAYLEQMNEWAQQMEFETICAPLELNNVYQTLRLEHVELGGVRTHVKERYFFVHKDFLSFFVEFDVLSDHT